MKKSAARLYLKEIGDWNVDYHIPDHTYIVNGSKEFCYGYIKEGETKPTMFKQRLPFSTSRRKFKIL